MNNTKVFVLISVVLILVFSLFGCATKEPSATEPITKATETVAFENASDSTEKADNEKEIFSEETTPQYFTEENDLELLTVPQDSGDTPVESPKNTEAATKATEANEEASVEATTATEVQKIELPFVPVS